MLTSAVLFLLGALVATSSAFLAASSSNVALYWGQNSYGNQQRLSYYCAMDSVDIVILSFVTGFPNLSLNFANQCSDSFSDGLLHCSQIAEDIKTCQDQGKLVLLSLGGASGAYGFLSDSEAETFATTLWNKFGGGTDSERPFDDAVVDGFDFDLENNQSTGTVALGKKLREIFLTDPSRKYYLSAAPQCPYPDASTGAMLAGVDMDFAFIQFYNNYCQLGSNFNWDTWQSFAEQTSPNKNIKMYVGLPGATSSASTGYADLATVEKYVTSSIKLSANFGGFMLWDASSGESNVDSTGKSFAAQLKEYAASGAGAASAVSSAVSSAASSAVSSTVSSSAPAVSSATSSAPAVSSAVVSSAVASSAVASSAVVSSAFSSAVASSASAVVSPVSSSVFSSAPVLVSSPITSSYVPLTSSVFSPVPSADPSVPTFSPNTLETTTAVYSSPALTQSPEVSLAQESLASLTPITITEVSDASTVTIRGSVITHRVTKTRTVSTRYVTVTIYSAPPVGW